MTVTQINTEILQGGFTNNQLVSIVDAVRFAQARLREQTKRDLRIGDNVNFDSAKLGRNVTGVVTKIAIKFVTVRTAQGLWRVPANMLTVIEDREYA
jgi:hypothetical protein